MDLNELLEKKAGIQLDIACGRNKQGPDWVGMDIQDVPGVDVVWDLNQHPWPLPDECVTRAIASHVLEHIPKVAIDNGRTRFPLLEFMNDLWRVMKPGGQFAIAVPHANSAGFAQDPTHTAEINERMWWYFDPDHPFYQFYTPKPWKVKVHNGNPQIFWNPDANIEVVLQAIK